MLPLKEKGKTMKDTIFTFKYEPKNFDDMILDPVTKERLTKTFETFPNLMLIGPPGIGKGTFTNIFIQKTKLDFMKINCSDETSIDNIRTKVKSFAMSLGITQKKIVVLNECLEENEEVIIKYKNGNIETKKLKDLPKNRIFDIISLNLETGKIENDTANIISDKIDDLYEVTLEDGRTIKTTLNHPFIIKSDNGKLIEKPLSALKENDVIVTCKI